MGVHAFIKVTFPINPHVFFSWTVFLLDDHQVKENEISCVCGSSRYAWISENPENSENHPENHEAFVT